MPKKIKDEPVGPLRMQPGTNRPLEEFCPCVLQGEAIGVNKVDDPLHELPFGSHYNLTAEVVAERVPDPGCEECGGIGKLLTDLGAEIEGAEEEEE